MTKVQREDYSVLLWRLVDSRTMQIEFSDKINQYIRDKGIGHAEWQFKLDKDEYSKWSEVFTETREKLLSLLKQRDEAVRYAIALSEWIDHVKDMGQRRTEMSFKFPQRPEWMNDESK